MGAFGRRSGGRRPRLDGVVGAALDPTDHLGVAGIAHVEGIPRLERADDRQGGVDRVDAARGANDGERMIRFGHGVDTHTLLRVISSYLSANTARPRQAHSAEKGSAERATRPLWLS